MPTPFRPTDFLNASESYLAPVLIFEEQSKSFSTPEKKSKLLIPYAVLCELTHRCPLACPYCSNPVELELKSNDSNLNEIKFSLVTIKNPNAIIKIGKIN